jgi:hypothetical protein
MVPVKIEGYNPRGFFANIINDRKIVIFNPFYSHMYDLGRNTMTLKEVGQSEESHWQEVDPDKLINRPIVISQLGDVKEETVHSFHRGNCKMSSRGFSTPSPITSSLLHRLRIPLRKTHHPRRHHLHLLQYRFLSVRKTWRSQGLR